MSAAILNDVIVKTKRGMPLNKRESFFVYKAMEEKLGDEIKRERLRKSLEEAEKSEGKTFSSTSELGEYLKAEGKKYAQEENQDASY